MSEIIIESNYKPTAPAQRFHSSDARILVLVGGLGSSKSYSVVKELEMTAMEYPGIPMAMYRKTLPALRDSTMKEFKESVDENLGAYKERDVTFKFVNGSFLNFRGLDEATKAKSTNYAVIVLEEAEEFTLDEFRKLNERVRALNKKGRQWPLRLILVLNPVDEDHWIYKQFGDPEGLKVWNDSLSKFGQRVEVIHFSTRDNLENLPPGYIEQVTAGMSPDEISRYIDGQWGTIVKGTPVYGKILHPDFHIRTMPRYPGQVLLRGWDFGFNHPATSFRLLDQMGRMNIAHAVMGEKKDLRDFIPQILQETLVRFGEDVRIFDYGDPRGHDKSPSGRETCFDVLKEHGVHAIGERGSREYVEDGIAQVRREFATLIEGLPQLTIDPGCSLIRAAYFGKYVRGDDGKPVKDGYYEHICDADRYISHHHRNNDAVKKAISDRKQKYHIYSQYKNRYTGY